MENLCVAPTFTGWDVDGDTRTSVSSRGPTLVHPDEIPLVVSSTMGSFRASTTPEKAVEVAVHTEPGPSTGRPDRWTSDAV